MPSVCVFQIVSNPDPFLRSMAYWVLEDYSRALDTMLEQPANTDTGVATECPNPYVAVHFNNAEGRNVMSIQFRFTSRKH